jgi:hypothetical protein
MTNVTLRDYINSYTNEVDYVTLIDNYNREWSMGIEDTQKLDKALLDDTEVLIDLKIPTMHFVTFYLDTDFKYINNPTNFECSGIQE